MVLQQRTEGSQPTVAKVRITSEFFLIRGKKYIGCLHKDKKIIFAILDSQLNMIFNRETRETADARWVFDFSDIDQVSVRLADGSIVFDMESDYLYRLSAVSNGLPVINKVPEIPISEPPNLQFINDFACTIQTRR